MAFSPAQSAALIAQARQVRDSSLTRVTPPLEGIPAIPPKNVMDVPSSVLTEEELRITSYDAPELIELMKRKSLSCETVTRAFLRRAALAQKLLNCITELLPEVAIERARYLDSLDAPAGPLHGLPVSVKEHHGMRGCSTNGGYVKFVGRLQPEGRISVNDSLYDAGCVFYARTTQPQAVMHLETSTTLYGVTTNPWNTDLTPGGSSGGESALVAFRGSVLGVGGDIGGSIRCPAANTGVYGLKPTPFRMGKLGSFTAVTGQEGVIPTQGPISTSRSGLNLFMETYIGSQPWIKDDYLVPIPWRAVTLPEKLKIAVMWSDGVVKPHPPVLRALREVVGSLKDAGIEVVDWVPKGHDECWKITSALYWEDGGKVMEETVRDGGEELLPLTNWLVKENVNVSYKTVEEICALKAKRNQYRVEYNDLWLSTGKDDGHPVDAILCPTGPGAAPPHGMSKYWPYTSQWNILEYPGAVFPVTTVDQKIDLPEKDYVPLNAEDKFNHELYEPGRYVDAPIGLQIVTRRFEDEKCLAVLEVVEKAMGRK